MRDYLWIFLCQFACAAGAWALYPQFPQAPFIAIWASVAGGIVGSTLERIKRD